MIATYLREFIILTIPLSVHCFTHLFDHAGLIDLFRPGARVTNRPFDNGMLVRFPLAVSRRSKNMGDVVGGGIFTQGVLARYH
jgi:hypothetical protein